MRARQGEPALRPLRLALLLIGVVGCSPAARWYAFDGRWEIVGEVPDAFRAEVEAAASVIQDQQAVPPGLWGGTVFIYDSVTDLDAWGRCVEDNLVLVVYNPAEGAGPEVGTTAIEHELCHAARRIVADDHSESGANDCARLAYPEILRTLSAAPGP